MTETQKKIVKHLVEDMIPGSQMSLNQINKVTGVGVERIYDLYEYVHSLVIVSFRLYRFTKEHDVGKTVVYRVEEY